MVQPLEPLDILEQDQVALSNKTYVEVKTTRRPWKPLVEMFRNELSKCLGASPERYHYDVLLIHANDRNPSHWRVRYIHNPANLFDDASVASGRKSYSRLTVSVV
jgi:hypothetical protein